MGCQSSFDRMLTIESAAETDDLVRSSPRCDSPLIWREKVVKWCYDVVDHLNEDRSIVYVAMHILDRHCASMLPSMNVRRYEVASLSCLFLAVHLAGSGELSLSDLVTMSRRDVSMSDIVAEGKAIIRIISHHPVVTPLDFVRSVIQKLPALQRLAPVLLDSASYMIELAVCDHFFSDYKSSVLAVAALHNALPGADLRAAVLKATAPAVDPTHVAVCCTRLACIYSQSVEHLRQENGGPHWIEDDDEEETVVPSRKRDPAVRTAEPEDAVVVLKRAKMTL
jgi:Cyclin, N-terminal domain/Cyclin, C-terminal domain